MTISDLISHVGNDHIVVQNILHSSPSITSGKSDGRITFYTDKQKCQDLMTQAATDAKGQWTALVLFIPTERLP